MDTKMTSRKTQKLQWIATYVERIMNTWQDHPGPFGIHPDFHTQISKNLENYYDDPLMRDLIELTYQER